MLEPADTDTVVEALNTIVTIVMFLLFPKFQYDYFICVAVISATVMHA